MSRKVFDKICLVCGERASGLHFGVITCESCKSFFRRNALKNKNVKCFLGGECKIDVFNKNQCKKCWINKCFDCGMKKELILNDEQKKLRKSLIEENRRRKTNVQNNSKTVESSNDYSNCELILSNDCLTSDYSDQSNSTEFNQIQSYTESYSQDSAQTNDFPQSVAVIQRPITDYKVIFNELEGNRLTELFNAVNFMTEPSVSFSYHICDFWDAIRILRQKMDIDIRNFVKMCMSLSQFKVLSEHDQIILVKFASIEVVVIRMILFFDFQFQFWNIITNSNNSNLIKLELLRDKNTYVNHKNFLQNFGEQWDSDPNVIYLLTAILLFNPNRPKLINQSLIKLQQKVFIHLLQRYLRLKYESDSEAKTRLSKLIHCFSDLHILCENIRLDCLQTDLHETPFLKEIFNRDDEFLPSLLPCSN